MIYWLSTNGVPEWGLRLYVIIKYFVICMVFFAALNLLLSFFLGFLGSAISSALAMVTTNHIANSPKNKAEHALFTPDYIYLSEAD